MNTISKAALQAMMLACGVAIGAQAAPAQVVLNMNSQWTATAVSSQIDKWFAEEVERRTDGDVVIRPFFGEGLGSANENLTLLREGAVDMAVMSASYFPAELPFNAAPNQIPMALETVKQSMVLMERLVDEVPAFREEQERHGIRSLFFHNLNPYYLVSVEPITSVEEMAGKRVRTWGSEMPRMVDAVGGVPVTLSLSELYESLSRGVVDAIPFSYDLIETYRIYEVAQNVSTVPLFVGPTGGVWIGEGAWQRLSPEQQETMLEVADEALQRDYELTVTTAEEARERIQELGVTIHEFPEEEEKKWRGANPDFFGDWVEQMEAQGKGDDARRAVEIWHEVRETVD